MSESKTNEQSPKKSSMVKKIFWTIGLILGLLGVDYFTYNFTGIGGIITVSDSSIVITPVEDSTQSLPISDTIKLDTASGK